MGDQGGGGYPYTKKLKTLASCTPEQNKVHEGEWGRIVTPLQAPVWEKGLASHPDREFADLICSGIREGVRLPATCVPTGREEHEVNERQ